MSNPVICGYVPPPTFPGATEFLKNVQQWKHKAPLLLFSDHPYPDMIRINGNPEIIKDSRFPDGRKNVFAIQNWLFFTAMRILKPHNYTHLIWLESDCRVMGDYWDEIIFEEAGDAVMAGSFNGYNATSLSGEFTKAWMRFIADNVDGHPIGCYGGRDGGGGAAERKDPVIFPNGAGACYQVDWLMEVFKIEDDAPKPLPPKAFPSQYSLGVGPVKPPPEPSTMRLAADTFAFDYALGGAAFRKWGVDLFQHVKHLRSIFSGYGEVQTSAMERRQMLLDGQVVLVHQIKEPWYPDVTVAPKYIGGVAERLDAGGRGSDLPPSADSVGNAGSSPAASTVLPEEAELTEPEWPDVIGAGLTEDIHSRGVSEREAKAMLQQAIKPRVDLFIVSHQQDFKWLGYCLRSIRKYASGFGSVVLVVPSKDMKALEDSVDLKGVGTIGYEEPPPPLGHLSSLIIKCNADIYSQADFICHVDADCVFTEPVTPDSYFHKDKPVLLKRLFAKLEGDAKAQVWWQAQTERALGIPCPFLTMCRHPGVFHRSLYGQMREWIALEHNCSFEDYVLKQKPTRLPGFSEFCALGAFALANCPNDYHWVDVTHTPYPSNPLRQHWSFQRWTPELEAELERIVE